MTSLLKAINRAKIYPKRWLKKSSALFASQFSKIVGYIVDSLDHDLRKTYFPKPTFPLYLKIDYLTPI